MATMAPAAVNLTSSIEKSCVPDLERLDLGPENEKPAIIKPTFRKTKIHYAIEFRNISTDTVISKEPVTSFDQVTRRSESEDAIFEVVASYATKGPSGSENMQPSAQFKPSALSKPSYYMNIYSPSIINALRSVVKYYPNQDLSGDSIVVPWPYCVIVHHYEQLAEYRDACIAKSSAERCIRDQDSEEHINTMLEYLDEHIMPSVRAEQDRVKRGVWTWENAWVISKPGNLIVFSSTDGTWSSGIIKSVTGGTFTNPPETWRLNYWYMAYDGDEVGRVEATVHYFKFDGENNLESEQGCDATKDLTEADIRALGPQQAKEYDSGKRYWELLRKQCQYYKGKTGTFPHNEIDGLVMADLKAYYQERPQGIPIFMDSSDLRSWTSDCICSVCQRHKSASNEPILGQQPIEALFEDCMDISLETKDELKPMQYMLLPNRMPGFVFSTRSWELLYVDLFQEPEFPEDMIGNLVMDQKRKKTLKALSKSFIRRNKREEELGRDMWSADFVKGKGGGLIFLLHGKPGVGKTCTAECIAAFTKRPLMTLTASDIGTDASEIEAKLSREFKTAKSWGAILLIDEADVFMENRSSRDLHRNSLVAGFLRALEYYDGILFLTTNRVGTFDDAFISRVHVQMYYPDFTDAQRQEVWMTFVDRLAHERGDYMRLTIDAKEYLRSQGVKAMKWNGREIRNTFQTAIALAEYDSEKGEDGLIKVTDEHFRPVIELSRDFKEYLDSLHKANEAKRAQVKKERLDSFVKGEGDDL